MHAQPQRTLKRLVKQYGHELVDDPRRTEALLRDLCGHYPREIFVLVNAQKQRVPAELLAAPKWMPAAATRTRLARLLHTKLAITEEAADWAVNAWATALEVEIASPDRERFTWLPAPLRPHLDSPAHKRKEKKRQQADSGVKSSQRPAQTPKSRLTRAQRAEMGGWQSKLARVAPALPSWGQMSAMGVSLVTAIIRPGMVRNAALGVGLLALSALLLWVATGLSRLPSALPAESPVIVAAQTTLAPATSVAPPASPPPVWEATQTTPAELLRQAYPAPALARVAAADGLFIREGPATTFARAGHVALNEIVRVVGYSDDGAWSNIDRPHNGWVSNEYLHFETRDSIGVRVQLRVRQLETRPYQAAVRSAPRPDAAVVATLPPTTSVLAVAATVGNAVGWLHITDPVQGWLSLNDVP